MSTCPCCSNKLLAHLYRGKRIWFCSHCRQEMPNLDWYKLVKGDPVVRECIVIAK